MGKIGKISDHQWGEIYDVDGFSPTLQAVNYKEPVKIMVDVRCLKQVRSEYGKEIRKQYENGKEVRWKDMKEYEPREDGLSNTLTGVIKDNMVVYMEDEKKIIKEGEMGDTDFTQAANVYSENGISPSVLAHSAPGSRTKVAVESIEWPNIEGGQQAKEGDGIVTSRPNLARSTVMDQCSFALTASNPGGVCVKDTPVVVEGQEIEEGDIMAMHTPGRIEKRQNGPRLKDDGTSFTVTAADKDGIATNENSHLRIRYLTPRECLRLQAFPDDAIDRLEKVLSKSAMYKVAGNSIAVCCLKAIFKGIYIDKTFKKGTRQISLNRWF